MVRWIVGAAAVAGLTACALLSSSPPDNVCTSDEQCFRAQGEVCNLDTKRCEPGPDGGLVDAGVDAGLVDTPLTAGP